MQDLYSRRAFLRASGLGLAGLAVTAAGAACGGDDDATPARMTMDAPDSNLKALVSGWYKGRSVKYYDFGDQTKLTQGNSIGVAPIYALIHGMKPDGTPDLVAGQNNIVDVKPGDAGYSDLWQVMMVNVPAGYVANTVKSRSDIVSQGLPIAQTNMLVNCPIVAEETMLEGGEKLVEGWYRGQQVFYPDFGANPAVAIPIWAFSTGMDDKGMPKLVQGQGNIIDSVPADTGYSAFWRVNLVMAPQNYTANSIKAADAVRSSGFPVIQTDIVVNCPVVSVA